MLGKGEAWPSLVPMPPEKIMTWFERMAGAGVRTAWVRPDIYDRIYNPWIGKLEAGSVLAIYGVVVRRLPVVDNMSADK